MDIAVPLLDMLRMEQIDAGASWVGEYGSVSNPGERAFWERTSPYQNLKERAHTEALQFTYFVRKLMDPLTTATTSEDSGKQRR